MAWRPPYATTEDLRAYLRVPEPGEDDDPDADEVQMGLAIEAASRAIDVTTSRQFGSSDVGESPPVVTRQYVTTWDPKRLKWIASIDDLMTVDDLVVTLVDDTVITDFTLEPLNAEPDGRPWTLMIFGGNVGASVGVTVDGKLSIDAHWGWPEIPDTIKNATLLQASRILKRRDSPLGVAGSPEMGNEMRLLAKVDVDVDVMVRAYRRWWGAV